MTSSESRNAEAQREKRAEGQREMMHVLIHYQVHPSRKEADISKKTVQDMISAAVRAKGGGKAL